MKEAREGNSQKRRVLAMKTDQTKNDGAGENDTRQLMDLWQCSEEWCKNWRPSGVLTAA